MPINPTSASNPSLLGLNQSQQRLDQANRQLISGERIPNAAVDPAGLQVFLQLQGQVLGDNTAIRNSLDGTSAIQIADGGLNQVTDSLQQIRELSIQAQNGILNDSDRAALQKQADQLISGISDTLQQSSFNGQSLLSEEGQLQLQTGGNAGDTQGVPTFDVGSELANLGLNGLDISSAGVLDILDQSQDFISSVSGELGASQNRLDSTTNTLSESSINQAAAASQIGDTDFAKAISEQTNAQIQQEVGIAIQAQANASRGLVLRLLGS